MPEKIFCLYHQQTDCPCIRPVVDPAEVRPRIEARIRINDILINYRSGKERADLMAENERLRKRLC